MSENYCILSIDKEHTFGGLKIKEEHNQRTTFDLPHVDVSKSHENRELIDTFGLSYKELWEKRIKEIELETGTPIRYRKNSVLVYECITSFSRDFNVDINKWCDYNKRWFFDTFGEKNILSMTLHLDESTPHIHTIIIPLDERNRLCARSFTGGRAKMRTLHTSYAKYMAPLGLVRGEIGSKSKKNSLNKFYAGLNEAANMSAPEYEDDETIQSYKKRVDDFIQEREINWYKKELDYKRKLELKDTKFAQYRYKYREASHLYNNLSLSFNDDEDLINERLILYQNIENSVPRKILASLLDNILKKFPPLENLLFHRKRKEKKKNIDTDL